MTPDIGTGRGPAERGGDPRDEPIADLTDDGDPVADFFAQHRAGVRPEPPESDRWEQIVHQANRPRRQPWWGLAAAVAAVLAIGTAAWSVQQTPFGQDHISRGQQVAGVASGPDPVATDNPSDVGSPAQQPQAVSSTFRTWSMSNAGSGTLYVLGSTACADDLCPTLLRTTDNGTSWAQVHAFDRTDTASVGGDEVPFVQPERAVTEVRFVSPTTGFVFGGDLWMTSDRGVSFTRLEHPGQTVLDVEIYRGLVYILSSDGCVQGRCTGPLTLSRASISQGGKVEPNATQQTIAVRDPSAPIDDAQLVARDGEVFVQPYSVRGPATAPWHIEGNQMVSMAARAACGDSPLQSLTAATNVKDRLFAACGGQLHGDLASYTVVTSSDRGRTWQAVPAPMQVPRIGRLSLAASDAQHVVVSVGGPRAAAGPTTVADPKATLQVTADGGRTWNRPRQEPTPPASGFDWTASPGGAEMYAIPRITAGYWHSGDLGETWTVVDPALADPPGSSATTSTGSPTGGTSGR